MNIAVCIKQVPSSDEVLMDPEKGSLLREGKAARINPYDLVAIEVALRIKEKCQGKVTALSMGPISAKEALVTCFSMGADAGVLLSDPKFAGADVYATSFTLAEGLKQSGSYDVIICGRQTTDGDTGQVGPAISEHLRIPHIYGVVSIDQVESEHIVVTQIIQDCRMQVAVKMPCLLIISKDAYSPRLPSLKLKLEAKKKNIKILTFNDMNEKNSARFGFDGSPTQVEKIYLPQKSKKEALLYEDGDTAVELMVDRFKLHNIL